MLINEDISISLTKLIEATRLVASDFSIQTSILPAYVHVPDEIALVFQDAYYCVNKLVEHGILNECQQTALGALNISFDRINSWTIASLREGDEWNYVRGLAKDVLKSFNETNTEMPNLFWIDYVPGDKPN